MPAPDGEKTRFAVAWSGLVYPTVSIGEPADLEADVKVIAEHAHAAREARANTEHGRRRVQRLRNERRSVLGFVDESARDQGLPAAPAGPVRPCRDGLGRGDGPAARRRQSRAKAKVDLTSYGISYVTLANDLAWYLFDRAVCADMRGDDAIALADARKLTTLQKAVEAQAEAMGFDHPRRLVDRGEGPAPYIEFLGQLPELLADHERRAGNRSDRRCRRQGPIRKHGSPP